MGKLLKLFMILLNHSFLLVEENLVLNNTRTLVDVLKEMVVCCLLLKIQTLLVNMPRWQVVDHKSPGLKTLVAGDLLLMMKLKSMVHDYLLEFVITNTTRNYSLIMLVKLYNFLSISEKKEPRMLLMN